MPPFHPFPHHHYQDDPHYKDPQHYQDHHHPHVWTVVTFLEEIAPFGRWYRSRAADGRSLETRSSTACHVGPLALKRLIHFASIIWVYPFKHI